MTSNAEEAKRLKKAMEAEIAAHIQQSIDEFRNATGFDVYDINVRFLQDHRMTEKAPRIIVGGVEAEVRL